MWDFEAGREPQPDRLFWIPIHENPFEKRPRNQIALVWKIVEALRPSTRLVEMMKHLINFHRPPLTPQVGCHTFHAPAILLPLLLREKLIAINLLHAKCPRDIAGNRDSRDPEVASESRAQHIHELISFLLSLPRERSY